MPLLLGRKYPPLSAAEIFLRRYFARRLVQPWQLPSIMRKHIYTGAMGSIWATLISGMFFVYFGNRIGLTPFQWAVMGTVASWALCGEIVSAVATQRLRRRKLIWFVCAMLDRGLRFVGIVVAVWLWHAGLGSAAMALIVAVSLANLFGAMAVTPWLSWLADIIPEDVHGKFWGRRSAWIAVAVAATALVAGALMDRTPEPHKMEVVLAVFVVATALGILDLVIHGTIPEPRMPPPPQRHFILELMTPIRDGRFRPWLIFNFAWTFSITLGGALSVVYLVENLKLKDNFVGGMLVLTAIPLAGSVATAGWSGALVDRVGPKRVIFWSHLLWSSVPLFWLPVTPSTALLWVTGSSIVGGAAATAGVNAATKLVTRFPSADQRAIYIAVSNTCSYVAAGLGCIVAGIIAKLFDGWRLSAAGWECNFYHVLFALSVVLRLASIGLFLGRVYDPPTNGATNVAGQAAQHAPS